MLNRGAERRAGGSYFDFVYQPVFARRRRGRDIVVIAHDVTALATRQARGRIGESAERRVPGDALARAPHAAERRARVHADAARRRDSSQSAAARARDHRTERPAAGAADRATCSTCRASSRASCGSTSRPVDRRARHPGARSRPSARRRRPRTCGCSPRSISPACRWPAMRSGCSRSCGTCCRTRSSSRRAADVCSVAAARVDSHVEIAGERHRRRHRCRVPPARLRAVPPGRQHFTRAHSGLGLGLAISPPPGRAHGGRIEATSPGIGRARRYVLSSP